MPLDVASAGNSPAAARAALDEAVRLFLKTASEHGSLDTALEEAGYTPEGSTWRSPAWPREGECVCGSAMFASHRFGHHKTKAP